MSIGSHWDLSLLVVDLVFYGIGVRKKTKEIGGHLEGRVVSS